MAGDSFDKKDRIPHQRKLLNGRRVSKRAEGRSKTIDPTIAEIVHEHTEVVETGRGFALLPSIPHVQGKVRAVYDDLALTFLADVLRGKTMKERTAVVNKETGNVTVVEVEVTPTKADKFRAVELLAQAGQLTRTTLIDGEGNAVPEEATRAAWGILQMLAQPKTD